MMTDIRLFIANIRSAIGIGSVRMLATVVLLAASGQAQAQETNARIESQIEVVPVLVLSNVEGTATAIDGFHLHILGGIVLDVSKARFISLTDEDVPFSAIRPGMWIEAAVEVPPDESAPLPTYFVLVRLDNEGALAGPLQGVDTAGGSLKVLNQRIVVNDSTSFYGVRSLEKLRVGRSVYVLVKVSGAQMIATDVVQFKKH